MFSTQSENCIPICQYFDITSMSLFAAELDEPKIGMWGKGIIMDIKKTFCLTTTESWIKMNFSNNKPYSEVKRSLGS